jgi:hypothetical protein
MLFSIFGCVLGVPLGAAAAGAHVLPTVSPELLHAGTEVSTEFTKELASESMNHRSLKSF